MPPETRPVNPLHFTPPGAHPRGTVFRLLRAAWDPLWNPVLEANLRRFDAEVFDQPETVGACTFITCRAGEIIGMASYDPRRRPARAEIGHNAVLPACRRQGVGRAQIHEILRRLGHLAVAHAWVQTRDEPFFVPAQRMYEACGFVLVERLPNRNLIYQRPVPPVDPSAG